MEIKERLVQIRSMKIKLYEMELTLAETRDRAIGQGSPSIDKLNIMTSLPADPMAEAIIEYSDMIDDYYVLKREYDKHKSYALRILKQYASNQDALTMLVMRYFDNCSFGQIGKRFGLDYHKAQSQVRWELKQINKKISQRGT